jgi:hypothetical protein
MGDPFTGAGIRGKRFLSGKGLDREEKSGRENFYLLNVRPDE